MITLDDVEYNVNSPEENAQSMRNAINQWCTNNNIVNRHGDLIQIDANFANPLYIILYGIGYLATILQNLLYSAGCALSIHSSSERQLLNIADVAGVKRKDPSHTSIIATVYSNTQSATAVACQITTGLRATVMINGQSVVFSPAYDVTVPVGSSRTIVLIAQSLGSFVTTENYITSFDTNPPGFRGMTSKASVPGQEQESISSLRTRLQERISTGTMLDQATGAIEQLPGVAACNIYFNKSVTTAEVVNSITVPPRNALLFVQGYNEKIAETYWAYMTAETVGGNGSIQQIYTTQANQALPVYIHTAEDKPVYIRLYFNSPVDDVTAQQMKDAIGRLSMERTIGQILTSTEVIDIIQANFAGNYPAGCQLSLDGETYRYQVIPGSYELLVFNNDNIEIIGEAI